MHCRNFALGTGRQIKTDYVDEGKVRFVYRHLAFLGQESVWAAEAAECAAEQGRFWDYHDILYERWGGTNVGAYAYSNLTRFAQAIGLDTASFESCISERRYVDRVRADSDFADDNGINSTPTVFINGERVRGFDYDTVAAAIESALGN